jgi:hypothetical protein
MHALAPARSCEPVRGSELMARRVTRRRLTVLTVAAAAAALAIAAWWDGPWRQTYAVPVPPPSAAPGQVVRAYLRALDAHDSATACALSAPGFRGTTATWLNSTASITGIWIGTVQYYPASPPGQRYEVPVTFRYASHWWKQDPSFPDGNEDWGYQLVHTHGRFLIDDDGTG